MLVFQGEEENAVQPTIRECRDRCGRQEAGPQLQRREGLGRPPAHQISLSLQITRPPLLLFR